MACGACAKKAAAKMAATQLTALPASITPVVPRDDSNDGSVVAPTLPSSNFVKKRYIGPSQRLVSMQQNLSYGLRNTGEVLVILELDYQAKPELWEDV